MDTRDSPQYRMVFAAFAAVAVTFVVATVCANYRTLAIASQTRDVSTNALPSIEHLVAASDALRHVEVASVSYEELPADGRPAGRRGIEGKWREVDEELRAYVRLPTFAGEGELYANVPSELRGLDEAVRDLLDEVDRVGTRGAYALAEERVRESTARVGADLRRLIRFNASHVYESARRIDALRERAALVALVLDAVAAIVALATAAWVSRFFQNHTRLLRDHGELLERRAAELEAFGRRVAHDLLSPLSALTYCLAAFKPMSETEPSLADALERARACVRRTQGMVEGIFEFSRAGGRPEPGASAPLREIVEHVADEVRAAEGRSRPDIGIDDFEPFAVACSRGVLQSILMNLVHNAAKFMADSPVRRIAIRAQRENRVVRVEVGDTGPGIAPELHLAIFEPYVRAEGATQPGLGLGLATVKRLCVAHGGDAGVRSGVGRGSVFWFTLPASLERPVRAAQDRTSETKLRRFS